MGLGGGVRLNIPAGCCPVFSGVLFTRARLLLELAVEPIFPTTTDTLGAAD